MENADNQRHTPSSPRIPPRRRGALAGALALLLAVGLAAVFPGCKKPCEERDDLDPCTVDTCENGVNVHTYLGEGHPCFVGRLEGACTAGWCTIPCTEDADCNDGKDCTHQECVAGVCDFDDPSTDTPGIPSDGNSCTHDSCLGGEPWYWPKVEGTPCNDENGECDNGICSSCETISDCGADTVCRWWECEQAACVPHNIAKGTLLVDDLFGDCRLLVCDGNGGVDKIADPNDFPKTTNPCLAWSCSGWTPVVDMASQKGKPCTTSTGGVVGVCDGNGTCVGCLDDGDCPNPRKDRCYQNTCVSCGDNTKNGDETQVDCGGSCGSCLGELCMADTDCASDECVLTNTLPERVCCDAPCDGQCEQCGLDGHCSPVPWGKPDEETCGGPHEVCNGAHICKIKSGSPCSASIQCLSNSCNSVTMVCN